MTLKRLQLKELTPETLAAARPLPPGFTRNRRPGADVPPPPTYNEDQLKAAERESYKKGFTEGTREGHTQAQTEQTRIEQSLAANVANFSESLAPLFAEYRQATLMLREQMPKVSLAIARKIAGDALSENAATLIETIALRCCLAMAGEPKIAITVNATLADRLERALQEPAAHMPKETHIVITGDPDIPLADCRIEWAQGGMQRNTDQLWEQVTHTIENLSTIAVREAVIPEPPGTTEPTKE